MSTALITGVAGGMGLAAAEQLLARGWTVWGPVPAGAARGLKNVLTDLLSSVSTFFVSA